MLSTGEDRGGMVQAGEYRPGVEVAGNVMEAAVILAKG